MGPLPALLAPIAGLIGGGAGAASGALTIGGVAGTIAGASPAIAGAAGSGLGLLGGLATGASVLSSGLGVLGAFQDAAAVRREGEFQAAQAGLQGATERATSAQQALQAIRQRRIVEGQAIAQAGASGLTLSGSSSDILNDIGAQGALEVGNILRAGELSGKTFDIQATRAKTQAENAARGATLGAFASAIGGVGSVLKIRQQITPKPSSFTLSQSAGPVGQNPLFY